MIDVSFSLWKILNMQKKYPTLLDILDAYLF
jgi:hypothetical protein